MTINTEQRLADDERFQSVVKWSNIPPNTYKTHRLYNFVDRKGTGDAYKAALSFVSNKTGHLFLTFVGEPGRGKTHLILGIGWHWLENNYGLVKYWQVESLLDDLRFGFSANTEAQRYNFDQLMNKVKQVPLLILDDLGLEQSTPWAKAKLDEIFDHRYINQLRTVVTTNFTLEHLEPRIASRLFEGVVVVLECDDYRKIKAALRYEREQAAKAT